MNLSGRFIPGTKSADRGVQLRRIGLCMEFFRNVNIDWMGKAKYFVALSLMLLAVGWISIFSEWRASLRHRFPRRHAGVRPFRRAASDRQDPQGLGEPGLPNSTIQQISDISDPTSKNDVVIGLEQQGRAIRLSTPASRRSSTCCTRPSAATPAASPTSIRCPPAALGRLPHAERSLCAWRRRRRPLQPTRAAARRRPRQGSRRHGHRISTS